jgi:hypothetical protein
LCRNDRSRPVLLAIGGPTASQTVRQAKDGSRRANGRNLTLPDGKMLFLGSSRTGAPNVLTPENQKKQARHARFRNIGGARVALC